MTHARTGVRDQTSDFTAVRALPGGGCEITWNGVTVAIPSGKVYDFAAVRAAVQRATGRQPGRVANAAWRARVRELMG